MAGIVFISSCARQDEAIPNSGGVKNGPPIIPRSVSSIADRLYFADFADFEEYYLELDSLLRYDTDMFDSIVLADSPVETINDLITTNSYSSTPFQTYFSDPVMCAIVNPNYEFQIGQVLVTYVNNSQILTSDASNSSLQTSIRAISKGAPLNISTIPSGAFWSNDENLEAALALVCGCTIEIKPSECDELRISGHCNNFFGGEGDGRITVSFDPDGAGLTSIILAEDVSGNYEFFIDVSLFQPGLLSATANPDCITGNNKTVTYYLDGSTVFSCDEEDRSTGDVTFTTGNERMIIKTTFNQNAFGYYHVAELRSQTLSGSKWSPSRANLEVQIDANQKSIGCDLLDSKTDSEDCNNCKRKITRVSWTNPTAHCDGDCVGTYTKIKSGITLSETQSVDFECCDEE